MLEKISALPLKQKIGQLFIIGVSGTEMDENMSELLSEISPGGVCLFSRNIKTAEQTIKLLADIRRILPVEPLLTVDQEGGLVDRLRKICPPMPAADSVKNLKQI